MVLIIGLLFLMRLVHWSSDPDIPDGLAPRARLGHSSAITRSGRGG